MRRTDGVRGPRLAAWLAAPRRRLEEKLRRTGFLTRIFLSFALISMATLLAVSAIVTTDFSTLQESQLLAVNLQILQAVDQYFESKCRVVKQIHERVVGDESLKSDTHYLLRGAGDLFSERYIQARKSFEEAILSAMDMDRDINHAYLCRLTDGVSFSIARPTALMSERSYVSRLMGNVRADARSETTFRRLFQHPALRVTGTPTGDGAVFALYDFLRSPGDISRLDGAIVFDYDCASLRRSYAAYEQFLKGSLYVLTPEGRVIYDSSGRYDGGTIPWFGSIQAMRSGSAHDGSTTINVLANATFDFITVGVIPRDTVQRELRNIRGRIVVVTAAGLLGMLALTILGMRVFSRRMGAVMEGIRRIQGGDLSSRISVTSHDEIGEISSNLNDMAERLSDHIEREYAAALRQKSAELYALQSQVNPHFLYNTLEVIRMKALAGGDTDVAAMIKTLATVFRASLATGMVTSLRNEMELCRSYLDLYRYRYEDRLQVQYDVEPAALECGILKHIMQPLVENALIHGVDLSREGNLISLRGRVADGALVLCIADNGAGIDAGRLAEARARMRAPSRPDGERIGLSNVNQRIRLLYGEGCGLTLESADGGGTRVEVRVAAWGPEELEAHVQGRRR